jgi:hypothetical protein
MAGRALIGPAIDAGDRSHAPDVQYVQYGDVQYGDVHYVL